MRKIYLFLVLMMSSLMAFAQAPEFTAAGTADADAHWYYLQFERGKMVVGVDGSGNFVQMEAAKNDDAQLWKLVGEAASLKLVNKATGKEVFYDKKEMPKDEDDAQVDNIDDNPSRFVVKDSGSDLELNDLGEGVYELLAKGETFKAKDGDNYVDKKIGINLWLGSAEGNPLGGYTSTDGGNKFRFVKPADIEAVERVLPEFSTDDKEVWYYVRFKVKGAVLESQGEGAKLMTAELKENNDAQLWKLVGTKTNYELVCKKDGLHVFFNKEEGDTQNRFCTSKDKMGELTLKGSANSAYLSSWCIGVPVAVNNAGQTMNQNGGQGAGKDLALWANNDQGNALEFLKAEGVKVAELPMFSPTADNKDQWYKLTFVNKGNVLTDLDVENVATRPAEDDNDAQLWKLVGGQDDFELVNKKSGKHLLYNGDAFILSDASVKGQLRIKRDPNVLDAWEILIQGDDSKGMNIAGGAADEGKDKLGMWNFGDANNPLRFVAVKSTPTPVVAIEKAQAIAVAGRTVTLAEAQKVVVYTVTGVKVLETSNATFTIPAEAGSVVILKTAKGVIKLAL